MTKLDENETIALDVYLKLMRAAETVDSLAHQHLNQANLTTSQFRALEALYHLGPLNQTDLAEKLFTSTGNISFVLDNLVKQNLVVRQRSKTDRRFITIHLTDTGQQRIGEAFKRHVAIITDQMNILTLDEQKELARLCRKLGLTMSGHTTNKKDQP